MHKIKTVALIGMGAIGSFFGPRMHAVLGEDFWIIAQGDRKKRLETRGITVNGTKYIFPIREPGDPRKADLVIISTKEMGLDSALKDIESCVDGHTLILPLLNGIESADPDTPSDRRI